MRKGDAARRIAAPSPHYLPRPAGERVKKWSAKPVFVDQPGDLA